MPEIKNTAEKETKSERKQSKRRITENTYRSSEATEKILAAVNTVKRKKEYLSVAGFSSELGNYQTVTVIFMTLGAILNEIFVYGLGICRQSSYKVGKIITWGGNTFPSTANCGKSKSQPVHFSLHTCLAFPFPPF